MPTPLEVLQEIRDRLRDWPEHIRAAAAERPGRPGRPAEGGGERPGHREVTGALSTLGGPFAKIAELVRVVQAIHTLLLAFGIVKRAAAVAGAGAKPWTFRGPSAYQRSYPYRTRSNRPQQPPKQPRPRIGVSPPPHALPYRPDALPGPKTTAPAPYTRQWTQPPGGAGPSTPRYRPAAMPAHYPPLGHWEALRPQPVLPERVTPTPIDRPPRNVVAGGESRSLVLRGSPDAAGQSMSGATGGREDSTGEGQAGLAKVLKDLNDSVKGLREELRHAGGQPGTSNRAAAVIPGKGGAASMLQGAASAQQRRPNEIMLAVGTAAARVLAAGL